MQSFVSVFLIDGYSQLSNLLVSRRVQVDAQTGQARTGEVPDKQELPDNNYSQGGG